MVGKAYLFYGQRNFSRGNMVVDVTTTKGIASFSGTRFNGRLGTAVASLDFNLEYILPFPSTRTIYFF